MEKTLEEQLEKLGVLEQFLVNLKELRGYNSIEDWKSAIHSAECSVSTAFIWVLSREGHVFWMKIEEQIKN